MLINGSLSMLINGSQSMLINGSQSILINGSLIVGRDDRHSGAGAGGTGLDSDDCGRTVTHVVSKHRAPRRKGDTNADTFNSVLNSLDCRTYCTLLHLLYSAPYCTRVTLHASNSPFPTPYSVQSLQPARQPMTAYRYSIYERMSILKL
jgi:hypothetical protein